MKRLLSALLVAVLLIGLLPIIALPASALLTGSCGPDATWTLKNGVLTISGTGPTDDYADNAWIETRPWNHSVQEIHTVVVEDGITRIGDRLLLGVQATTITLPDSVTSIGDFALYACEYVKSIRLPANLQSLGSNALDSMRGLTELTVPESCLSIDREAFGSCDGLKSITLPSKLETISSELLFNCTGLTKITIPETVTEIGYWAFLNCTGLKTITIPKNVRFIGDNPLAHCDALTEIRVAADNPYYYGKDGVLFCRADAPFADDTESLVSYPAAKQDSSYVVPTGVQMIGTQAFVANQNLTTVTLPGSVSTIGTEAFSTCKKLQNVTMTTGVRYICDGAFQNCTALQSVKLPESLEQIGTGAFSSCKALTSVEIPSTVTRIERMAFMDSGLKKIAIRNPECKIEFMYDNPADKTIGDWEQVTVYGYQNSTAAELAEIGYRFVAFESCPGGFVDVDADSFCAQPVVWAVDRGITNGMSDISFGVKKDCTRGQIATFLWRAFGSPEPKHMKSDFTDLKEGTSYYKAVMWAVENGITTGTSETTFSPSKPCTRGQVVTFLWRAEGQPEPKAVNHPFTDLKEGASYYKAVLWAVENGITNGVNLTTFGVSKPCTRGQVVTFLYRELVK